MLFTGEVPSFELVQHAFAQRSQRIVLQAGDGARYRRAVRRCFDGRRIRRCGITRADGVLHDDRVGWWPWFVALGLAAFAEQRTLGDRQPDAQPSSVDGTDP